MLHTCLVLLEKDECLFVKALDTLEIFKNGILTCDSVDNSTLRSVKLFSGRINYKAPSETMQIDNTIWQVVLCSSQRFWQVVLCSSQRFWQV